jgi:hypothetical protein
MLGFASSNGCTIAPLMRWKRLTSPHATPQWPKSFCRRSDASAKARRRTFGPAFSAM